VAFVNVNDQQCGNSPSEVNRLKAELAALPKKLPEPFIFDWKQVQAEL
jgi:hypothetical protein